MKFARPDGSEEEKHKYVIALRTSQADLEAEVPIILCSTDQQPESCRPFEVQLDPFAEKDAPLDRATKVDCRWVFTVSKRALGPVRGRISEDKMSEIGLALFKGLQMG